MVWEALSELFLDTEIDLEGIAERLKESGFSLADIEHILKTEVAPVLGGNLFSVAGEWAFFDLKPVEERYLSGKARASLEGWVALRMIREDWQAVKSRL